MNTHFLNKRRYDIFINCPLIPFSQFPQILSQTNFIFFAIQFFFFSGKRPSWSLRISGSNMSTHIYPLSSKKLPTDLERLQDLLWPVWPSVKVMCRWYISSYLKHNNMKMYWYFNKLYVTRKLCTFLAGKRLPTCCQGPSQLCLCLDQSGMFPFPWMLCTELALPSLWNMCHWLRI